jgi:hypothetical protein
MRSVIKTSLQWEYFGFLNVTSNKNSSIISNYNFTPLHFHIFPGTSNTFVISWKELRFSLFLKVRVLYCQPLLHNIFLVAIFFVSEFIQLQNYKAYKAIFYPTPVKIKHAPFRELLPILIFVQLLTVEFEFDLGSYPFFFFANSNKPFPVKYTFD